MAMMRLLARSGLGLAVAPPIVVQDELAADDLMRAARLDGVTETFYAVTLKRRFPNPLLGELLANQSARWANGYAATGIITSLRRMNQGVQGGS